MRIRGALCSLQKKVQTAVDSGFALDLGVAGDAPKVAFMHHTLGP